MDQALYSIIDISQKNVWIHPVPDAADQPGTSPHCTLHYSCYMRVLKMTERGAVVPESQHSVSPISPLALSVFVYN